MKHSWQELENGTARCRRCPAVRTAGTKATKREETYEYDDVYNEPFVTVHVEHQATLEVTGAHPTKCGKPAR